MGSLKAFALLLCLAALAGCDDGGAETPTPQPDQALADAMAPPEDAGPDARPDATVDDATVPPDVGPVVDAGPDADLCPCPGRQTCDDEDRCVEPATCMGNEDCIAPRVCVDGACEDRCRDDADCPRALVCGAEQRCVEASPCVDDRGCFEGNQCVDGACTPPCTETGCPGNQVCVAETGRCRAPDRCEADADCPGMICEAGSCVMPCAEAAACPGAQACEAGRCVEPARCASALDCRGDRVCEGEICADPCPVRACPGSLACVVETGLCAEASPCEADDGCLDGRLCLDGACSDPCRDAADCAGAQRCVDGRCTEPEPCNRDLDCLGDRHCDEAGACVDPCTVAGCPAELACDAESGRCGEREPCRRDAECWAGRVCQDATCVDGCFEDAQCPGALRCRAGRCVEAGCFGDADCLGDRVCRDLLCADPCDEATPCVGALECRDGGCQESGACAADRDCLGLRRCAVDLGVCADPCDDDRDCGLGRRCRDDGLCSEVAVCDDDAQCAGERRCVLAECRTVRCEADAACPEGERCVDFACRADVPGACDCPAGHACRDGRCEPDGPCAADAECGGGGHCLAGVCAACRENAECPGALTCEGGACVERAPCLLDSHCLPGRACEGGACQPDGACVDDVFGPHNTPDTALIIEPMVLTGLRACEGEGDWFRLGTEGPGLVVVRFDPSARPLAVQAFSELDPFTVVDADPGRAGEAWVALPEAGAWLIYVQAGPGSASAYTLDVRADLACVDDATERPWRNDVAERAVPLAGGRTTATLCGEGDVDWYLWSGGAARLSAVGPVTVTADGQAAPVDLAGGERVLVSGESPAGYALVVEPIRDPAGRCALATPLTLGQAVDLNVGEGPDDFEPACFRGADAEAVFAVELDVAGTLRINTEGDAAMAPLALYGAECGDAPLACAGAGGLAEDLPPGRYHVVVDGPVTGRLRATLDAAFVCAEAEPLPEGATEVVPASLRGVGGGCLGQGDVAVRRVELAEPAALTVVGEADAQIAVAVRGDCLDAGSEVACEAGFGPAVQTEVLPAGTWYVLAAGADRITLRRQPAIALDAACGGPAYDVAPGDRLAVAGNTAGAGDDADAAACGVAGGAPDQALRFRLANPARVSASLEANGWTGHLTLRGDACAGEATCGTDLNPSVAADLGAGVWTVVVDGQGAADAGPFTLRIQVDAP